MGRVMCVMALGSVVDGTAVITTHTKSSDVKMSCVYDMNRTYCLGPGKHYRTPSGIITKKNRIKIQCLVVSSETNLKLLEQM